MSARLAACACILAGGQSRRMGTNKALLPFQGEPLIARVARRLAARFDQVVVVTNTPEVYAFLGLPMVGDRAPGLGPLAGIEAGLAASRHRAAFFTACDMPFLDPDLAAHLVALAQEADAVVPVVGGQPEPACAAYTRDCLPAVAAQLDAGELKIAHFFARVRVRYVTEDELRAFGPPEVLFFNCNTPADLAAAQALAERLSGPTAPPPGCPPRGPG